LFYIYKYFVGGSRGSKFLCTGPLAFGWCQWCAFNTAFVTNTSVEFFLFCVLSGSFLYIFYNFFSSWFVTNNCCRTCLLCKDMYFV
jgi:hypothetical protein